MPWLKLDDKFPDHPKVETLSDAAFRLHVSAMCHSARYLTDGHIAVSRPEKLINGYCPELLDELLAVGLWEQNGTGYVIHDFTEWNKTREWWQNKRAEDARRLAEWRAKQAEKQGDTHSD
jgi:hypothetical protein